MLHKNVAEIIAKDIRGHAIGTVMIKMVTIRVEITNKQDDPQSVNANNTFERYQT